MSSWVALITMVAIEFSVNISYIVDDVAQALEVTYIKPRVANIFSELIGSRKDAFLFESLNLQSFANVLAALHFPVLIVSSIYI